jgi:spore coat protein SA
MKPKICLVPPWHLPVPAVKGGAVETLVQMLLDENEAEQRIDFLVISIYDREAEAAAAKYKHTRFFFVRTNALDNFIDFFVRAINKVTRKLSGDREYCLLRYYKKCFEIIGKERTDFIVNEGWYFQQFKFLPSCFKREQIYMRIHSHYVPSAGASKILSNIFGGVIGISRFVISEYLKAAGHAVNAHIVMNSIDVDLFRKRITPEERLALREKLGFSANNFVVLFCGRIIEVKGVRELIKAVVKISDDTVKLLIVGSQNFSARSKTFYLKEIEYLIACSQGKIVCTGYIKNDELYKFYQSADIMAIPSLWEEGFGLVVAEGLASGLPLIVTNSGAIPEIVSEKSAIIVERDDRLIDNLSAQMLYLYGNTEKRRSMADAAVKESARFSREKYYHDFISVFEK